MLHNIFHNTLETMKDWVIDYSFFAVCKAVIAVTSLVIFVFEFLSAYAAKLPVLLLPVFTKPSSPYHWKKFKKEPLKTLLKLSNDRRLRKAAKYTVNVVSVGMALLAVLMVLAVFEPRQGMHVRDMATTQNYLFAAACLSVFSLLIIFFKATSYHSLGLIKSLGDFKLGMIFR